MSMQGVLFFNQGVFLKEFGNICPGRSKFPSFLPIPHPTLSSSVLSKPEACYFKGNFMVHPRGHFIIHPILQCLPTSHLSQPSAVVEIKPLNQWQAEAFKSKLQGTGKICPLDIPLISLSVQNRHQQPLKTIKYKPQSLPQGTG